MNKSILTKNQKQTHVVKNGNVVTFCNIRFDDECGNSHNTFSITGEVYEKTRKRDLDKWDLRLIDGVYYEMVAGGCIHDVISQRFPQFKHLIKYHLCIANSPMHYKANTKYFASQGLLESARKCAVWDEVTLEQLMCDTALDQHLIELQAEFKHVIESIGFTW